MGEAKRKTISKEEAFKANPDDFVNINDIAYGFIRAKEDLIVAISPDCPDLILKQIGFDTPEMIRHALIQRYQERAKKEQSGLIVPEGQQPDNGKPRF